MHQFNMNFVKGNPAICTTGFAGYACKKQREQTTPNAHMSIGYNMTVASRKRCRREHNLVVHDAKRRRRSEVSFRSSIELGGDLPRKLGTFGHWTLCYGLREAKVGEDRLRAEA